MTLVFVDSSAVNGSLALLVNSLKLFRNRYHRPLYVVFSAAREAPIVPREILALEGVESLWDVKAVASDALASLPAAVVMAGNGEIERAGYMTIPVKGES